MTNNYVTALCLTNRESGCRRNETRDTSPGVLTRGEPRSASSAHLLTRGDVPQA
jgi:hypothetical protein